MIDVKDWVGDQPISLDDHPKQKMYPHGSAYLMGLYGSDTKVIDVLLTAEQGEEMLSSFNKTLIRFQPSWNPSEAYYRGVDLSEVVGENNQADRANLVIKQQHKNLLQAACYISQAIALITSAR